MATCFDFTESSSGILENRSNVSSFIVRSEIQKAYNKWCIQQNSTCVKDLNIYIIYIYICRSEWPCGLRRRSVAARLPRSWVRIPPRAWMFVCCECCVLSGRGLCDELITRPEQSYRVWCVVEYDLETSRIRRP